MEALEGTGHFVLTEVMDFPTARGTTCLQQGRPLMRSSAADNWNPRDQRGGVSASKPFWRRYAHRNRSGQWRPQRAVDQRPGGESGRDGVAVVTQWEPCFRTRVPSRSGHREQTERFHGQIPYSAEVQSSVPVKFSGELNGEYSGETELATGTLTGALDETSWSQWVGPGRS